MYASLSRLGKPTAARTPEREKATAANRQRPSGAAILPRCYVRTYVRTTTTHLGLWSALCAARPLAPQEVRRQLRPRNRPGAERAVSAAPPREKNRCKQAAVSSCREEKQGGGGGLKSYRGSDRKNTAESNSSETGPYLILYIILHFSCHGWSVLLNFVQ